MDFGLQSGTNLNTRGSSGREIETKNAKLQEKGYHRKPLYQSAGPGVLSRGAPYTPFLQQLQKLVSLGQRRSTPRSELLQE